MPNLRLMWLLSLVLAGPAQATNRAQAEQTAIQLREARDQIDASTPANVELYQRYVEAFPSSFDELIEVLVLPAYREILVRPDEDWNWGLAYMGLICQSYERVDHRQYMRKMLRIGISANDWGARDKDHERYLDAGNLYRQLIHRLTCNDRPRTEEENNEQLSVIYSLLPEFTDAEIEAIYNSLSWEEEEKWPLDWFLKGICSRYPNRCPLTQAIRKKYAKHFTTNPHPH